MSEAGSTPVLLAVAGVLAADDVLGPQRRHRVEDLLALEPERLRLQRGRRLHRDEAEHLEEVGDDHVAEGAGFLVEAPPHLDRERLRDVDLDVVDVVAVPDRLEHPVGEAHGEQVLHRLAAEVVVDAVDAALLEDAVQRRVERPGRLEVGAERLLGDHPRALSQPDLPERRRSSAAVGPRRQREVEQDAGARAPVPRGRRRPPRRARRSRRRRRRSAATPRTGPRPRCRAICGPSPRPTRGPARGTPRRRSPGAPRR